MKTKALWIFLGTIAVTVGSLLLFIQSKYFADVLKQATRKFMPTDFGLEGDFSELAVKMIPPGVVIKNPAVVFKEKNPANLPAGTKLDAQYIDLTFQFFQLLTGQITVNAVNIHGATLKLDLDRRFFEAHEKSLQPKKSSSFLSWDKLLRFDFRSVSLLDSQIDITMVLPSSKSTVMRVQSFAKELTVGRSTVDEVPGYDIAIDFQKALVETEGFKHSLAQLQASAQISTQGVAIRNFALQEGEMNFHTNGNIRGNVLNPKSLRADLAYILRGPIAAWLDPNFAGRFVKPPKTYPVGGSISIEGKLKGDLLDLKKTAETKVAVQLEEAHYGDWRINKGLIKATWKAPVVMLESADLQIGEGSVKVGKASYDTDRLDQSVKVDLDLDNVDLRKVLGPIVRQVYAIHLKATGKIGADVQLGQKFSINGNAKLIVRDFSLDNQKADLKRPLKVVLAVKEVEAKAHFKIDQRGFAFDQAEVTLPNSKLKAYGSVTEDKGIDIDVQGNVDTADIGKLGPFNITGHGPLHWTIKGKKPFIVFTFDADFKDASYLDLKLGAVKGRVSYNDGTDLITLDNFHAQQGRTALIANGTVNVGDDETVALKIQVPSGTIEDFAFLFSDFLKRSVPWYPYDLAGKMSGLIKVSGKTDMAQLSALGDMELHNVDLKHEIIRHAKLHAGYRRGAYVAENVVLQKKAGWLRGNFAYNSDETIKFDLKSDGLSTFDIDHLAIFGIPYRAPLNVEANGSGKLGNLRSSLRVHVGEGFVKNVPVASTDFAMIADDGRIRTVVSAFGGKGKARIDYAWAKGSNSTFDFDAKNFDFRPMILALNPDLTEDPMLEAQITGSAHLRAQTGALSKLTGTVSFDAYRLQRTGYSLELAAPLHLDIANGDYQFSNARLIGTGTSMVANGRVQNGKIDYKIAGDFSLGFFEFLVKEIAAVKGSAKVDATLTGIAESPDLHAKIVSQTADLRLRHVEQPFEDLKFNALWRNDHMLVSDVSAKFAGGMVRGSGSAVLYLYKAPDLDFKAELDNPKVKVYPVVFARTTGRLNLSGEQMPYKVTGTLNVAEALIKENFAPNEGGRVLRTSKFLPQSKGAVTGELELFDLDIDIRADRNIFVRNDLFDAEVKGNLKVINTIQAPRLLGDVEIIHGKLLFKDNFFVIQSGSLRFSNPIALDPEFDLNGHTEVKGYKVLLVANGRASDYRLNFQSQPPLSQNDIVNLLTLGVTSSDFKNISRENRDAYSRDEMYGLLFNQSGINKGLQEKLGVRVKVDQTQNNTPENVFRARQTADSAESIAPKVVLQKQITKNLNASVGSTVGVGGSQERNADIEFGIGKNWSVLGTYEDQRGSQLRQSRTSIGADLKYKLRFK